MSATAEIEPVSSQQLDVLINTVGKVILGKPQQIKLLMTCLLAGGHVLIEDLPGMGKTTLAHALARVMGLGFQRIQFTSDLLPADILGVSIYDRDASQFKFHYGPIFAQMILADEINRATPKTQSALLEAMEEKQVTIEGETRPLHSPFFVLATQNPHHQIGTFPLPESQLDRFTMRISLGYPSAQAERQLLKGKDRREMIQSVPEVLSVAQLRYLQKQVSRLTVSEALLDYIQAVIKYSRQAHLYRNGLSPRAGLSLLRAAQAWALLAHRDYVIPEDIQAVLPGITSHRLINKGDPQTPEELVQDLIQHVPVPL